MTKLIRIGLLVLTMLMLSGCWDYKEIHQITYITTLGVDYKDQQFIVYAQSLNFANIAQTQGQRPPHHAAVVGTSKGQSLTQAIFNLYKSGQQFIYFGHISAVIFSEQALKQVRIEQLTDTVNRFRELRYNVWMFGTDTPIELLLNTMPNFGYSPYDSILMKPMPPYRQFSNIKPVYMNRFITDYFERGKTAMMPKLGIDNSTWTEGGKKTPELTLLGAYVFSYQKYRGELTDEQLTGRRYLETKTNRAPITLFQDGQPAATLVLTSPAFDIQHTFANGKIYYDVKIKVSSYLDEMLQDVSREWLRAQIAKKIEGEVRVTYNQGKKIKADVLNLSQPVFRYHYKDWKQFIKPNLGMENIELRNIEVLVIIKHSAKYKARVI